MLCSVIANANRGPNRRPFKPSDFFDIEQPRPNAAMTPEQLLAAVKYANDAINGRK